MLLHAISTVQRGFLLFCQISLAILDLILGRGSIGIFRFERVYFVLPLTFLPNQQALFYQEGRCFCHSLAKFTTNVTFWGKLVGLRLCFRSLTAMILTPLRSRYIRG